MSAASSPVPVIAIDGPSASGKGTVAAKVAEALGFRYLDSGALYRLVALAAIRAGTDPEDEAALARIAANMNVEFRGGCTWLDGRDAGVETRADRRYKQLMEKGMYAKMGDVVEELRRRDERDSSRPVAPLKHYPDAFFLDTTTLTVDQAVEKILGWWGEKSRG